MLADVRQATIRPVIEATVAEGALVHTDEYGVYARLEAWGYRHKTVCHARGEYARDEDGFQVSVEHSRGCSKSLHGGVAEDRHGKRTRLRG